MTKKLKPARVIGTASPRCSTPGLIAGLSGDDAAAPGSQQPPSCLKDERIVVDRDDKLGD
jgi:hypothetical protein